MSKARKFVRFTLLAIIVIALGGAIAYFAVLPKVARRVIESVLSDAGIEQTSFDVKGVNLQRLSIQDLELGEPAWASAGGVRATYGLSALWSHRVNTLTLERTKWHWTIRDGEIDFGMRGRGDGSSKPPADFPFDRLEIRNLALTIDHDQRTSQFTVNGIMKRVSSTMFDLDLDLTGDNAAQVRIGTVVLVAPAARLHLGVSMTGTGVAVSIRPESTAAVDAIVPASESTSWRTAPVRLILADSGKPLIRWSRNEIDSGLAVNALIKADGTVQVDAMGAKALFPTASASISMTSKSSQPAAISADVTISNATVKHDPSRLSLAGIDASIPIDLNGQTARRGLLSVNAVTWRENVLPGFTANVGYAEKRIALEGTWDMGDMGRFTIAPVQFDPANPVMHINLTCERIGLEQWLPMLTDSRAFGTGSLSGALTMDVSPGAEHWVSFVRGTVSSDPGGGRIQSRDARALSQLLEESDPRFIDVDHFRQIKERVIAALEDFSYDHMEIEFKPVDDRVPFSIDVRGKGRQGPSPQELALTLNVNDFLAVIEAAQIAKSVAGPLE